MMKADSGFISPYIVSSFSGTSFIWNPSDASGNIVVEEYGEECVRLSDLVQYAKEVRHITVSIAPSCGSSKHFPGNIKTNGIYVLLLCLTAEYNGIH